MSEIAHHPRPEKIPVPTGQLNAFLAVEAIRTAPLTSAKSYFSESRYSARYVPATIPWPMTLAPTNEAISREITREENLIGKKIIRIILGGHI